MQRASRRTRHVLEERAQRSRPRRSAKRLGDKLYQRLGWQPRCKPTVLPTGRILLPLYTDTFSFSLMAVSDDEGKTWYASEPLDRLWQHPAGRARRKDGTLVAYMRENGPLDKIRVSESNDDGLTWGAGRRHRLAQPRQRARRACGWPTATGC